MNEKHEFQVGDLVRLKSVEEILALGFSFNERGEITYPKSKEVLLLNDELKHCDKEFVVDDFSLKGHAELNSTNSSERIVNICPSVLELVEVEEVEFEDWISKPTLQVKPGDKVRIKTHEELLASGWVLEANGRRYFNERVIAESIVGDMLDFFGEVCTVKERFFNGNFLLKEDESCWIWTSHMVAEVITDEEGNPFDPNADYIEEEDYQPYCAVVDEMKPTTWDKGRIQRGFENLEMYHKGYADGFQRAMELMKKEFGVE